MGGLMGGKVRAGLCVAAAVLGVASGAMGVDSKVNAALRYWRAWSLITEADDTRLGETAWGYESAEEFVTTPELVRFIEDKQQAIGLLREAAAMPECDFGVDFDKGPYALLTHLRPMRTSVHLLTLDARLHANTGDTERAVDDLVAAYRMERHMADGSMLINSLVTAATFEATTQTVERLLDEGLLDAAGRARIDAALAAFDGEDPYGIKLSLATERDVMVAWMRTNVVDQGGEARRDLETMTAEELMELSPDERQMVEIFRNSKDIKGDLDKYSLFYDHALAVWGSDKAEERLATLTKAAGDGQYGFFAKLMAPAMERIHPQWVKSVDRLAGIRARLAD
ncbi:MAG: hypothetical protein KDA30_07825 [Phycisphaerales bacterium]|nr:hypothetical protein [Phycisphaerales bacterium]